MNFVLKLLKFPHDSLFVVVCVCVSVYSLFVKKDNCNGKDELDWLTLF